jgi:hypothetical protein
MVIVVIFQPTIPESTCLMLQFTAKRLCHCVKTHQEPYQYRRIPCTVIWMTYGVIHRMGND